MAGNFSKKYGFRIAMACEASIIREEIWKILGTTRRAKIFHLSFNILGEEDEDGNSRSISKQI